MGICCCSLAGTVACVTCNNKPMGVIPWMLTNPVLPHYRPKTIREYDKDGNLIKETIE